MKTIQVSKGSEVEIVSLLKGEDDFNYMKQGDTTNIVFPEGVSLPPQGKFNVEGGGGVDVSPEVSIKYIASHSCTYDVNQSGGIAFDHLGNVWVSFD